MNFLDLFLLAIAVAVLVKLHSVLGRRSGGSPPGGGAGGVRGGAGVRSPLAGGSSRAVQGGRAETLPLSGLSQKAHTALRSMARADRRFSPESFLAGARRAYAQIVLAFARGEEATLSRLVAPAVLTGFRSALALAKAAGETAGAEVERIDSSDITDASLESHLARITIRFRSRQIAFRKDSEGRVIEGDAALPRSMTDLWTFERDLTSQDPNWRVVATAGV